MELKSKHFLAGLIILLTLTGCGKAEAPDVGMAGLTETEGVVADVVEMPEDMPEAERQDELQADQFVSGWKRAEGSHVYAVGTSEKQVLVSKYLDMISTEEEYDMLIRSDFSIGKDMDVINKMYQSYPLTEYSYIFDLGWHSPGHYQIQYNSDEKQLRFRYLNVNDPTLNENGPYKVFSIAAVPKEFLDEKQIDNLYVLELGDIVEEAHVNTINCGLSEGHSFWEQVLIRTEDDFRQLTQRDEELYSHVGEFEAWIKEYPFSEYNYIITKRDERERSYPYDSMFYYEDRKKVSVESSIIYQEKGPYRWGADYGGKLVYRYVDIAIIPKAFFEENEIENLLSPQEWREQSIVIL